MKSSAVVFLLFACMQAAAQQKPKLFVFDTTTENATGTIVGTTVIANSNVVHYGPKIMAEFAKKCPAVSLTTERASADFTLQGQSNSSVLSDASGAVVYISKAYILGHMVKDVCAFLGSSAIKKAQ